MVPHPHGGHHLRERPSSTSSASSRSGDSPNSAGVVIDAIRCAKLALDRKIAGPLLAPSAYFMKSPPEQWVDFVARERLEEFIAGEAEPAAAATEPS